MPKRLLLSSDIIYTNSLLQATVGDSPLPPLSLQSQIQNPHPALSLPRHPNRRRQRHPTPVLLPGKSHGRRSLMGCNSRGHKESERTERLSLFTFTFHFHALEKEMATHSSVLAWRIPGTGEPGGLPSMGSHRVGHD